MTAAALSFALPREEGPVGMKQQPMKGNHGVNSRVRMMYWTMHNHELADDPPDSQHSEKYARALPEGEDEWQGRESGDELPTSPEAAPEARRWPGPQLLVVPSLHPSGPTAKLLDNIAGLQYYEERQLYHLFLLRKRDPTFRVIFVSSTDIPREVIAYYFRLMRSIGRYLLLPAATWSEC